MFTFYNQAHLPLPYPQGQLYCAAGKMPALLSAAASEMPGQLSSSHDLGASFPTYHMGQQEGVEGISLLLIPPYGKQGVELDLPCAYSWGQLTLGPVQRVGVHCAAQERCKSWSP